MIKTEKKYNINLANNGLIFMRSHTSPPQKAIIQINKNNKTDNALLFNIIENEYRRIAELSTFIAEEDSSNEDAYCEKLLYKQVWKGVDLVFSIINGQLKYEFIVYPGADLQNIKFKYSYADTVELDDKGNLIIKYKNITLIDQAPISYQIIEGIRVPLKSQYVLNYTIEKEPLVTIDLSPFYDSNYILIIDPCITFLD